jgi:hypothetical protein
MLRALDQAGPAGLGTNEAGVKVFNSLSHGWKVLKQADQMGYIARERSHRERGGHYYIVNRLTARGRRLLRELDGSGHGN